MNNPIDRVTAERILMKHSYTIAKRLHDSPDILEIPERQLIGAMAILLYELFTMVSDRAGDSMSFVDFMNDMRAIARKYTNG